MKEEIKRVLKMLEEGKIDLDKASELIEAISTSSITQKSTAADNLDKMLKVKVLSATDKVNVTIPVKFLKAIGNAVNNIKIPGISETDGIDIKMIMDAIDSGIEGKIVDVTSDNGDIVEVYIG